jgi:hypothetical protein
VGVRTLTAGTRRACYVVVINGTSGYGTSNQVLGGLGIVAGKRTYRRLPGQQMAMNWAWPRLLPPPNGPALVPQRPCVPKQALSQPFRIRQRDEVTASNFLHLLFEPFAGHTLLEFDREKAVISSRQNMNGNVGPALEAAGLAENGLRFLARLLRSGA